MSAGPESPGDARAAAERVLASGMIDESIASSSAEVLEPVAIQSPVGEVIGWFVGIGSGDRLLGFLQLDRDRGFLRSSFFARRGSEPEALPAAGDWLDPSRILERAKTRAQADERLSPPLMTYDRSPERLVWAVRATDPAGRERTIFVAGDTVYEAVGGPADTT